MMAHLPGETSLYENYRTLISLNYLEFTAFLVIFANTYKSEVRFQSVSLAIPSAACLCGVFIKIQDTESRFIRMITVVPRIITEKIPPGRTMAPLPGALCK